MQQSENPTTEQRILLAAEEEFLEKGLAGARTTAIAEKAGVTHAMLHYYFRTKEKLFQQILLDKMSRLKGMMVDPLIDREMPLFDKVKYAIETHMDFLAENPNLPRFMLTVMQSNPEWQEYVRENASDNGAHIAIMFQKEIDLNAAQGRCRKVDARMLLLNIVSLNIFSFIGAPLINGLLGDFYLSPDFIQKRKENNVEMILKLLKP